jgi:ABC-type transport system substrate-binding protein
MDEDLEFLRRNLADAGINVKIVKLEYAAFIRTVQQGEQDQMGFTASGNLPDVDSPLFRHHYPGQPTNFSKVNDPRLNEMLAAQRREANQDRRRQLVSDIQKYLAEQQYFVCAPWRENFQAVQPWVKGLGSTAFSDLHPAWMPGVAISHWWIDRG